MSEALSSDLPPSQETTLPVAPESRPNRVILRCRVSDFDKPFQWYAYPTAVEAYLRWAGRSLEDYKERKHNVFVELLQDPELRQTKFHIIIDFYSLSFDVQNLDEVHHEIFLIRRDDKDELHVLPVRQPAEAKNLIRKIRHFADDIVPWGTNRAMGIAQKK